MLALGQAHGFTPNPRPGFVGMPRVTPDGQRDRLDLFTWSNRKHAAASGLPRAYLVVCLELAGSLDGPLATSARAVAVEDQPTRQWGEVASEFDEVFGPALRRERTADLLAASRSAL